jgi:23S rRNA-/tRNA-specific pseudouridylate synthase
MPGGKPALTEFTVLASAPGAALAAASAAAPCSDAALAAAVAGGGLSLIRCRPQTGRTHQVGRGSWGSKSIRSFVAQC